MEALPFYVIIGGVNIFKMTTMSVHGGDVYRHPGVLDFSSNMNPLGPPRAVLEAAEKSISRIRNYPDVEKRELRKALALDEGVQPEQIIFGNGAAEVIFMLSFALRARKALVAVPTFLEYETALKAVDTDVARYYLDPEQDFRVDEGFLHAINASYGLVVLCNPNNPTGLLIDPDLLRRIVEKCQKADIRLFIDECFLDFTETRRNQASTVISLKRDLADNPNLFILKAFTKRYAMAGLRLGYGLCSDTALLERMKRMVQPWNVSLPAQAAGLAALGETEYLEKAGGIIQEQREYLKNALRQKRYKVWDSQANYIFFQGPEGLEEKALASGLLIRSCANYPGLDETYYRIAVRLPEENRRLLDVL